MSSGQTLNCSQSKYVGPSFASVCCRADEQGSLFSLPGLAHTKQGRRDPGGQVERPVRAGRREGRHVPAPHGRRLHVQVPGHLGHCKWKLPENLPLFISVSEPALVPKGKGVPDLSTRQLLRLLHDSLAIKFYCLTDANPYGIQIMTVYKYGSKVSRPPSPTVSSFCGKKPLITPGPGARLGQSERAEPRVDRPQADGLSAL